MLSYLVTALLSHLIEKVHTAGGPEPVFDPATQSYVGLNKDLVEVDRWWLDKGRTHYWSFQRRPFQYKDKYRPLIYLEPGMELKHVCEISTVWFSHLFGLTHCGPVPEPMTPSFSRSVAGMVAERDQELREDEISEQDPGSNCHFRFNCRVPLEVFQRAAWPLVDLSRYGGIPDGHTVIWRGCQERTLAQSLDGIHRVRCPPGTKPFLNREGRLPRTACLPPDVWKQWMDQTYHSFAGTYLRSQSPGLKTVTGTIAREEVHHVMTEAVSDHGPMHCLDLPSS